QSNTFIQQRDKSYAQLLKTPRALDPVAEALGDGTDVDDLADQITAVTPPDTVMFEVSVTDPSPEHAQSVAAPIGESFPGVVDEIERPSDASKRSRTSSVPATFRRTQASTWARARCATS